MKNEFKIFEDGTARKRFGEVEFVVDEGHYFRGEYTYIYIFRNGAVVNVYRGPSNFNTEDRCYREALPTLAEVIDRLGDSERALDEIKSRPKYTLTELINMYTR